MLRDRRLWGWLAAVCAAAALLGFEQLVRLSVVQGDERRAAARERQMAVWRCALLPASLERRACRAALP
ncbi:hypothetical protein [Rubrivivax gelatinosus]|uniref:Uncharacterized protein n=1 Tax=Rubrivivax gelatinosus TaxID=28068 RepID=A0A4R2MB71_RUBGE|nr:hypothetical protein [Rubrivivax gelatinosus]MBK1687927.1 hypothetical protein [Rubrivivax gelatinosus]TCP01777.1 hypothetical protein EV684_108118 [Rubrivivax gelatinosus]